VTLCEEKEHNCELEKSYLKELDAIMKLLHFGHSLLYPELLMDSPFATCAKYSGLTLRTIFGTNIKMTKFWEEDRTADVFKT